MTKTPEKTQVAIACQGGSAHTAFTAGALIGLLGEDLSEYRIIGLSGTSGGTMCAFLAWYGLTTAGPEKACELLKTFWQDGNSAKTPWEVFENGSGLWWQRQMHAWHLLPLEFKLNPYEIPLQDIRDFWATASDLPFIGPFIAPRPTFVSLQKLLEQYANFDHVRTIVSIQKNLQQILRIITATITLPEQIVCKEFDERLRLILLLANVVSAKLANPWDAQTGKRWISETMSAFWSQVETALQQIDRGRQPAVAGDRVESTFAQRIQRLYELKALLTTCPIPVLLLGAVDVLSGEFKTFDSRNAEITMETVLASTILPELFQAQAIGNQRYWDGLFSQNPPLRNFLAYPDDPAAKPDQIWLLRIDPADCRKPPITSGAIEDRRNQLSCNLSLHQEIAAITAVNNWLSKFEETSREKYKHVDVLTMRLDHDCVQGPLGGTLDRASRLYRGSEFIADLMEHGKKQAHAFLPLVRHKTLVRRFVEEGWNKRDDAIITILFDDEHRLHTHSSLDLTPGDVKGKEQITTFIDKLCDYYITQPKQHMLKRLDLHVTIEDLIAEGDRVAFRWTLRGKQEKVSVKLSGSSAGQHSQRSGTGSAYYTVKVIGTWISRIAGGKFVESWVWDTRDLVAGPRTPLATVQPQSDPPVTNPSGKSNREVVTGWFTEGWNKAAKQAQAALDRFFAVDYIHNDYGYFPDVCDRPDYRLWFGHNSCAIPSIRLEDVIVEEDRVAVRMCWPADESAQHEGVVIYRVAGGAIQESWWTWDTQQLLLDHALHAT